MATTRVGFSSTWIVVVAVMARSGERNEPLVLAAKDVDSGMLVEIGVPKLLGIRHPPYPTDSRALLITIDAHELVACHLALDWRVPERIVDLMVEFRNITNGQSGLRVGGLPGALLLFGRPAIDGLVAGNSPEQMRRRLAAVVSLFDSMQATLDLGRAQLRGRYMCAVARIESVGVPIDRRFLDSLSRNWSAVRARVVEIVDQDFGVYRGLRLDHDALLDWLVRRGIAWPRLEVGRLDLGEDSFRELARAHPEVRPLKELKTTLHQVDPASLPVGRDGRNRTPLRPFASRTGRNQPSANASVFGNAAWARHLVRPAPGMGLALIDWSQQEFGIAAALSGDTAMQTAYRSGDPYLSLAILAGAAPTTATRETHPDLRSLFKTCALGIQYGMGTATLSRLIGQTEIAAQELQRRHKTAFPAFWRWSDAVEAHALLSRDLTSVFGWRIAVGATANPRALRNFPLQANGAEMLRLACCLATEAGIRVCMPLHDALLIEAPIAELDETIVATQEHMAEASRTVLDGFVLRSDIKVVRHPARFCDSRGAVVWRAVELALEEVAPVPSQTRAVHGCHATCASANPRTVSLFGSKKDKSDAAD